MKRNPLSLIALFAIAILLGQGCATSNISLEVLKPADISLPPEIKTIALVNRFKPEKGKGFLNVLEGALSGENIGQDRNGAEASLSGLTNFLAGSPRYRIIRPAVQVEGHGRGTFPAPLSEDMVRKICRDYNTQALVTIEAFDSDSQRSCEQKTRKVKRDGEEITEIYYRARQRINVYVGWRLYSAETGTLIDEFRMEEQVRFRSEGGSENLAYRNLPSRERMVQEMGAVTGEAYALRIAPIYLMVNREYYTGGTTALKLGKDKVRMNDWEGAEKHWDVAMTNEKEKIQGRGLYNKAVAAEVRGDLDRAYELAQEAYSRYGNRKAREYARILNGRILDREVLDEQMQGAPD